MRFIDLFAGAGGLSEGFIRAGFTPVAHVEMDRAACFTLSTRVAFHYLKRNGKAKLYEQYLRGVVDRQALYAAVPDRLMRSVINEKISDESVDRIFDSIDQINGKREIDAIVGGRHAKPTPWWVGHAMSMACVAMKGITCTNITGAS